MKPVSRRVVLRMAGAGAALAGVEACSRGRDLHVVPYVNQPPEVTPGVPSHYATVVSIDGYGVGVIAESHEGRPTKLEGNPRHPGSLGALGPLEQASLLDLYDPQRARAFTHAGQPATWAAFAAVIAAAPKPGRRTHVLLPPLSGPHLVGLVAQVRARGDAVVHFDSVPSPRTAWEGARLAFGSVVEPRADLARARVVVSLDADFLAATSGRLGMPRAWATSRSPADSGAEMSRLYVVEPRLTVTGMAADERRRINGRGVVTIAAALLREVRALAAGPRETGVTGDRWAFAVARDLSRNRGASLVIAGDAQPPEVHVLAHALNDVLGNVGHTVTYGASPIFEAGETSHDPSTLLASLDAGEVDLLLMCGGDPAYTGYGDVDFQGLLARAASRAYVGSRVTRTALACEWTCAESHWLEAWSDARAFDGTVSIAQPLVAPLVDGRSIAQILAVLTGRTEASSRDLVREHWQGHAPPGGFDQLWADSLVHGVVAGSTTPTIDVHVDQAAVDQVLARTVPPAAPLEIAFYADGKVHDGRFGDNPWLQELPDPVTKLTWDNAALLSPATAAQLGVSDGRVVELGVRGRTLRAPVLTVPGMADRVVALALGYGQQGRGPANGVGADAYAIRSARAPWFDDVSLHPASGVHSLALAQEQSSMHGRPIVLDRTLAEYRDDPSFAKTYDDAEPTLYDLAPDAPHQWGMTIDLGACTGCSACVVACMIENNVPTVGKAGVGLGRGMYWLRIDRYFSGDPRQAGETRAAVQPMACQQCEHAPCEYVCPVEATVHSHDGLNEMVYNRCVGTRFCSNNCPYKVRRFNFFDYDKDRPEPLQLAMNPDVTVRSRGVMEKCTYCVQRIREAEIAARRAEARIVDGAIVTACQQTCPTGAIVFGDVADPGTAVSRVRRSDRRYQVLHDLGTIPRTRYLARVTNPNPELDRT